MLLICTEQLPLSNVTNIFLKRPQRSMPCPVQSRDLGRVSVRHEGDNTQDAQHKYDTGHGLLLVDTEPLDLVIKSSRIGFR